MRVQAILHVDIDVQAPAQHPETDEELCKAIADHLLETFNDDDSILSIDYCVKVPPTVWNAYYAGRDDTDDQWERARRYDDLNGAPEGPWDV